MSETTKMADVTVQIEGDTYSLLAIPDPKSKVVQAERDRVLRNIDLNKLITGLTRTGDLLYLAYNGVADFGELTSAMTKLHDGFGTLCGKCNVVLGAIERESRQIQSKLKYVFKFLLVGEEKTAIDFLTQCGDVARDLSAKSAELSTKFDNLGNDTVEVLSKTQIVQGQQIDRRKALEQQTEEMQAKTERAKKIVEGIAAQKKRLEGLYLEAKSRSETAENRAFTLSIVSAIMKPIADGIGVFGAAYAGGGYRAAANAAIPPQAPPAPSKADAEKELEAKQTDLEKAAAVKEEKTTASQKHAENHKKTVKEAETKEAAAENARKAVDAEKDSGKKAQLSAKAETADMEARQAREKAATAKTAADDASQEAQDAEDKWKLAKAACDAAQKTLTELSEKIEKMSESYAQIAAEYNREKTKYLEMLMAKEDMEREATADIAEYAIRMKDLGTETATVEVTCTSLFHAIGALKQVAVILRMASQFWLNMAAACDDLAKDDLKKVIEGFSKLDKADRIDIFTGDDDFKEHVIRYFAGWKAIEVVANEYATEANRIQTKVHGDFQENPSKERSKELAVILGGKLVGDIEKDRAAAENHREEIERALKEQRAA